MIEAVCISPYANVRQTKTNTPNNNNIWCTTTASQEYKLGAQNPLWI